MKTLALLAIAASAPAAFYVSAHAGCEGYQHGKDLWKRDPSMQIYEQRLRERFPQVKARVQHGAPRERRQVSKVTGALTQMNTAVIAALSSGSGTSEATSALPTAYAPGSASPVQGAPPLPNVVINPAEWPALDHPPPIDTPQVQQWLSEINLSGIPTWAPTNTGYCTNASNADAVAAAAERCWWTCGGCTRATDITFCPTTNTWGLSYDDGPSPYTPKLLDYMSEAGLTATIFTVGSRAISRPEMLQYEYMAGNQIAVHTWSHFPLTTLTNEQIVAEFGWSKQAIYEITGVTPNYMRPPYGDMDDRVRYIAMQMGLTPVVWTAANGRTFDTQDWQIAGGVVTAQTVVNNFESILSMAPTLGHGFIVLEHDLYQQSVDLAVDFVLPYALTNGTLTLEPIITCLGKNMSQAYIETASNSTTNAVTSLVGASGTGFVPGLSTTEGAIGAGATVAPTPISASSSGSSSGSSGKSSGSSKSASASSASSHSGTGKSSLHVGCAVIAVLASLAFWSA